MKRVLLVGLRDHVTLEVAHRVVADLKAKTGLDVVVVDGCAAIVVADTGDDQ